MSIKLPKWVQINIVLYLDITTINKLFRVNKEFLKIDTKDLWKLLVKRDYPEIYDYAHEMPKTKYKNYYLDSKLEYPNELINIFSRNNLSIHELPIIDIGERQGATQYIDFFDYDELTSGIMRFIDIHNRQGIVFGLKGISDKMVTIHNENICVKSIVGTLSIFKRYTSKWSSWSYGWGNSSNLIEYIYNTFNETSENIFIPPGNSIFLFNLNLIDNLLSGKDILFGIK